MMFKFVCWLLSCLCAVLKLQKGGTEQEWVLHSLRVQSPSPWRPGKRIV